MKLSLHGRTREQGFGGTVNLAGIRAVAQAVKHIPVIGNGDVTTPQAAKHMLEETGCAGVSVGRGAFYDPWIFKRTLYYLQTSRGGNSSLVVPALAGPPDSAARAPDRLKPGLQAGELLPEPPFTERVRVLRRHFDLMIEVFGEELGCRMFRKVAPWYAKRFGPAAEFNKGVVRIATRTDFEAVLAHYLSWRAQFVDEQGELLPRFQQAPMVASFMQEPGVAQRQAIPVPKGPVDVW